MDSTAKEAVAAVLRKVADAIKRLDAEDWEALLGGNFAVEIVSNGASSNRTASGKETLSEKELVDIRQALSESPNRESGLTLLEARCPSKEVLLQLSRHLDIPAQKRESFEKLREKIVETTIGFRLRSRAVQGESPPGTAGPQQDGVSTTKADA